MRSFEAKSSNIRFFEQGKLDCELGFPVKNGQPNAYYEGFAKQYELEQKEDYKSGNQEKCMGNA